MKFGLLRANKTGNHYGFVLDEVLNICADTRCQA
jgi:hypothetical protein